MSRMPNSNNIADQMTIHPPAQTVTPVPANDQTGRSAMQLVVDHTRQSSASRTESREYADQ